MVLTVCDGCVIQAYKGKSEGQEKEESERVAGDKRDEMVRCHVESGWILSLLTRHRMPFCVLLRLYLHLSLAGVCE